MAQNSPSWLPSGVTFTVCAQAGVRAMAVIEPANAIASVTLGIGLSRVTNVLASISPAIVGQTDASATQECVIEASS